MSINIGTNIGYQGEDFLDNRVSVDSIEDLKKYNLLIPDGFEVYCEGDKSWYVYRSDFELSDLTGRFRKRAQIEYEGSGAKDKDTEILEYVKEFQTQVSPYKLLFSTSFPRICELGKESQFYVPFWITRENTSLNHNRSYTPSFIDTVSNEDSFKIECYLQNKDTMKSTLQYTSIIEPGQKANGGGLITVSAASNPTLYAVLYKVYINDIYSQDCSTTIEDAIYVTGEVKGKFGLKKEDIEKLKSGDTSTIQSIYKSSLNYLTTYSSTSFVINNELVSGEEKGYICMFIPENFAKLSSISPIGDKYYYEQYFDGEVLNQRTTNFEIFPISIVNDYGVTIDYAMVILDYPINYLGKDVSFKITKL